MSKSDQEEPVIAHKKAIAVRRQSETAMIESPCRELEGKWNRRESGKNVGGAGPHVETSLEVSTQG